MSINLLEKIQQNLGYPTLKKIDPNTQDAVFDPTTPPQAKLAQAAIPSVLAILYKFLKTDEGVKLIMDKNDNEVDFIFEMKKSELIKRVSAYCNCPLAETEKEINRITIEAINLLKENIQGSDFTASIKNIISDERNNILPYLPAVLNVGELLNDTTLDDKTNKMEGPISNLMHKIEKGFSKS